MNHSTRFSRRSLRLAFIVFALLAAGAVFAFSNASTTPNAATCKPATTNTGCCSGKATCTTNQAIAPAYRSSDSARTAPSPDAQAQHGAQPSSDSVQIVIPAEERALRAAQDSILMRYPFLKTMQFKNAKGGVEDIFGRPIGC